MGSSRPTTMRAVIMRAPGDVVVEQRPIPKIADPTDAVIKVTATALCGSDLHPYRGHLKTLDNSIPVGHEVTGTVDEVGSSVKNFKPGDHVVVPFYAVCGHCFYCVRGEASRCSNGKLFGNSSVPNYCDGCQAEYVRIPMADATLVPSPKTIPQELLVLMADIFPTGYFAAARFLRNLSPVEAESPVVVVVGCGPVGCCAIASALHLTKGKGKLFAVDGVPERLAEAEKLGAIPVNLKSGDVVKTVKDATEGRGADVVIEGVGHADALELAFDCTRPFGKISSIGVHTDPVTFQGPQLYGRNITMAFGRCPVRSIFEDALAVMEKVQDKILFLTGRTMSLDDAPEAYKLFDQRKVHKIIFKI